MPDHFTQLLEWRRNELAVRGLAKLPPDFYPLTTSYLAELRHSYESELRENPSGRKGDISRQTYQRAIQVARDIVEGRVQKILNQSFQASIGGSRDLPNALPEEREMFDRVLAVLIDHRRSAASYIEPTTPPVPPSPTPGGEAPVARPPPPPPPAVAPPAARSRPNLVYVRVVKESRPVEVGSETVDLRVDDVLSLPAETARLLVDAKVAEPLESAPSRPVT